MKHFLVRYRFLTGSPDAWHLEIERFVAALDADPELHDRISYRCTKVKDGADYVHLATAADDEAVKLLGTRSYFIHYTRQCDLVSNDGVEVLPLELIARTA